MVLENPNLESYQTADLCQSDGCSGCSSGFLTVFFIKLGDFLQEFMKIENMMIFVCFICYVVMWIIAINTKLTHPSEVDSIMAALVRGRFGQLGRIFRKFSAHK